MAEPFEIIGVIGVAGQIVQMIVQLGFDWKDAPSDTKAFLLELQALKTVLSETHMNLVLNKEFVDAFEGRHSTILSQLGSTEPTTDTRRLISTCQAELETLLDTLKKRSQGRRAGWERLKGAFLLTRTREAVENLHRQCTVLNKMAVIDIAALSANTHQNVMVLRDRYDQREASEEEKRILSWLTRTDYTSQQDDYIKLRQPDTGEWFLNAPEFISWLQGDEQMLFCPGIPGAGKTVLAATVIQHLTDRFHNDPTVGRAYIYYNFRRKDEQKLDDLLASLLKQLSETRHALPNVVKELYERCMGRGTTRPSTHELFEVLQSVSASYSRVFIVVDALDECHNSDGCRREFLSHLFALQSHSNANILVTSRPLPEIVEHFEEGAQLEIRATDDDIRKYLKGHMAQLAKCVTERPDLQAEIITAIVKVVSGMFLLARLHFESLKGKRAPKAIRNALGLLPTGKTAYDEAYENAMVRIKGQLEEEAKLASQVLSWIVCAERPLKTSELKHALAVEVGESQFDQENICPVEDMVSVCAGLVTVDEESQIIRLVHYTTQEYFQRTQARWFPKAELEITTISLTYLSFEEFKNTSNFPFERIWWSNFYKYASDYWGYHAHKALDLNQDVRASLRNEGKAEFEESLEATYLAVIDFLGSEGYMATWMRCWLPGARFELYCRVQRLTHWKPESPQVTALHVAAYFGLENVAKALLQNGVPANPKDLIGQTPLDWAAGMGHDTLIELLLATGEVDVDSRDETGGTPLAWAAAGGHVTVVERLIATGKVDADSRDIFDTTPLARAAAGGHVTVVERLLARGVDFDSRDKNNMTPLMRAVESGHLAVAEQLIAVGASVDLTDEHGETPLFWAAGDGDIAKAEQLLAAGADPNFSCRRGRTVLGEASLYGQVAMAKWLVAMGADAHAKSNGDLAPIICAAENGHIAIVEWLLAMGVDPDPKNILGETPLSRAAKHGHIDVVERLLATGKVDPDSRDIDGRTPLSLAAANNHIEVVERLLVTGQVDPESRDDDGQTPFSRAAGVYGRVDMVERLFATGQVDPESRDNHGRTPLNHTAESGKVDVVEWLLATGKVDPESRDIKGRTPLSRAATNGYIEVVERLLATGKVDPESRDNNGRTPLSWAAAKRGGIDLFERLLATGQVDPDSKDNNGRTPLSWAAVGQIRVDVVEWLLATGQVDPDSRDNNGRTPFSWAAASTWRDIELMVRLHATGQVDPDSKDNNGRTPLSWAAAEHHRIGVVRWLLATPQVDPDSRDKTGRTPLSFAAENRCHDIKDLLLATGKVNPNSKDMLGRTPEYYASQPRNSWSFSYSDDDD